MGREKETLLPVSNKRGFNPQNNSTRRKVSYAEEEEETNGKQKRVRKSAYRRQIMRDGSGVGSGMLRLRPIRRYLDPATKVEGTEYDISTLITDYRNIMFCVNEHNKWIGKLMGGAQAANYAQVKRYL
jgi:hypothetical protein